MPQWDEWICQKHWTLVPRQMRRAYSHAKRRKKPVKVLVRLWGRCKTAVYREVYIGIGI
jgi:hypothetical protein